MKEFYPLDHWLAIEEDLLNPHSLSSCPVDGNLDADSLRSLCAEINQAVLKASSAVQKDSVWVPVRESITPQHRVDASITPQGMSRGIKVKLDMSAAESGLEDKLIGKSVQTVPSKISFIVKKVGPKHPLFQFSGKQMNAVVSIDNVHKPPFKTPSLKACESTSDLKGHLLDMLRAVPFHLGEKLAIELSQHSSKHPKAKVCMRAIVDFLHPYSQSAKKFKNVITEQIQSLGTKFDPEMELSFVETLYQVFQQSKNRYSPIPFQNNIEALFLQRFDAIMSDIVGQMTQQQMDIRQRLTNFSEVESERQRLVALAHDLEQQKKKGVGDEVIRRSRQDLNKLAQRIHRKIRQYESSKGIILIQELYISAVEKAEHLEPSLKKIDADFRKLKSLLQANHISASRDIEQLTHNLGVHAHHLLIQHAIYSEVEPDLDQVVAIDSIGQYDMATIQPTLNLMPTVKQSLEGKEVNANNLLKAILDEDLPEREKNAFLKYCQDHPNPKNNEVQRFSQQTEQFIQVSRSAKGVDGIVEFISKELLSLKAVLRFGAEQNKLTTDFRNHLRYYEKLFIAPYFDIIEQAGHPQFEDLDRSYGKIANAMKVQMEIRYTAIEEKALLSIFRQINSQLQNDNLFAAKVFTKQVKNVMAQLTAFKDKISAPLMKKILETYTIYMMGSSRTRNLSRQHAGLNKDELEKIRSNRDNLTKN